MTDIQSIIIRYISGEASPEEADMVESWIASSAANRQEFETQWRIMNPTRRTDPYILPDPGQEWSSIKNLLGHSPAPPYSFKTRHKIPGFKALLPDIVALAVVVGVCVKIITGSQPLVITQTSGNHILTQTLPGNILIHMDKQSRIRYCERSADDRYIIDVAGKVYIDAEKTRDETSELWAGGTKILPEKAKIYISFSPAIQQGTVHVQSGRVHLENNNSHISISAGESVVLDSGKVLGRKDAAFDVNSIGALTKIFDFRDLPLSQAVIYLEKAYHVPIQIHDPELGGRKITSRFENKTLNEILDVMSFVLKFQYQRSSGSNQILISKNANEEN